MPIQNTDLRYRLIGQDVSAGSTFRKVSQEAQAAHSAIGLLGNSLNNAGAFTPLQQGLSAIGQAFQHIQDNGKRAAVVMQGVGIGIAGVGAALLAVGGKEQQATAGLKASIEATGAIFADYSKQIEATIGQQEQFGHAANDTEDALSRLTQATNDPTAALGLMGLAANVAAARNISLNDAASTLAQGLAGNTRAFRQFGITLDGVGTKADQIGRAFDQLQTKLSGQAASKADTFTGHIKAMGVQIEDTISSLTKFAPLLLTVGTVTTGVGAATDLLTKRRERLALADAQVVIGETRVANAELTAGVAARATAGLPDLRSAAGIVGVEGVGGASLLARGGILGGAGVASSLLRGGGVAVGGLLAGQLAGSVLPGQAGSTVGDALSFGGTGAGLGLMVGGPLGAAIGGGLGALGGGLFGLFHHSGTGSEAPSPTKIAAALKNLRAQEDAQTNAALSQTMAGTLPGEFDALGNPKAAQVATATNALANARDRLATATASLSAAQRAGSGPDPQAVAAAQARVTAAEAALTKARYVGGPGVARAEAAVASAELALSRARDAGAGSANKLAAAERNRASALRAVHAAEQRRSDAKAGVTGLTLAQFEDRQSGNLTTLRGNVHDQSTLVEAGVAGAVIAQIDTINKQLPGTLHNIAKGITPAMAAELNRQHAKFDLLSTRFGQAAQQAATAAGKAIGQSMAVGIEHGFLDKVHGLALDTQHGPLAPKKTDSFGIFGQKFGPTGPIGYQGPQLYVNQVNVRANDPNKFTHELAQQSRQRALSTGRQGQQRVDF